MSGFDPDAYLATSAQPTTALPTPQPDTSGFDPDAFIKADDEQKYGTPLEMAKTAAEGAAEGVAGPLAPAFEKQFLGATDESIGGRKNANPILKGVSQAGGLAASLATGVGEGAIMAHAGEAAASLAGLGEAAQGASLGFKIGSNAVKQAAEMSVLQGSDEIAKQVINDPAAAGESAIANIGLSAALGGAFGGATGAAGHLWSSTAGPKVDEFLTALKSHINGESKVVLPDAVASAEKSLGIELPPAMRSALSGNPKAADLFNELREAQHPEIMRQLTDLRENSTKSILSSLNTPIDEVAHYDENEAGHELLDTFKKEYEAKYGPLAEEAGRRRELAETISLPDEERLQQYGRLLELGVKRGTAAPEYKLYQHWGERLLAEDTLAGVDELRTRIGNDIKKAIRADDGNTREALQQIRDHLGDFQERQITKQAAEAELAGAEHGKAIGRDIVNDRAAFNKNYTAFSRMSEELQNHLGTRLTKASGLSKKLEANISPEDLLKKFSPQGNADAIPFLEQHFPDTAALVRQNEAKKILRPAVIQDEGKSTLNMTTLGNRIDTLNKGQAGYLKWSLPEDVINKVQAARTLNSALPEYVSSRTAGWTTKMYKHVPASAMAAIGWLTGHGPIFGYVGGEIAQRLGKDAPEAIKLGLLNFMSSEQPVKAEGFKAGVDFLHHTIKGESALAKAADAVFKSGAHVLMTVPSESDRSKLDKIVDKMNERPEALADANSGHLGHYFPQHQMAVAQSTTQAMQYLQQKKPKPFQGDGPYTKEIPPSSADTAAYNRSLDIGQKPLVVLHHIKQGTLQASDIQDLNSMYPSLYPNMVQKLTKALGDAKDRGESIPYHTRMAASLFLGSPIDSTFTPASIIAAQPVPQPPPQPQGKKPSAKASTDMAKGAKSYQTASQSAESDRGGRNA